MYTFIHLYIDFFKSRYTESVSMIPNGQVGILLYYITSVYSHCKMSFGLIECFVQLISFCSFKERRMDFFIVMLNAVD